MMPKGKMCPVKKKQKKIDEHVTNRNKHNPIYSQN